MGAERDAASATHAKRMARLQEFREQAEDEKKHAAEQLKDLKAKLTAAEKAMATEVEKEQNALSSYYQRELLHLQDQNADKAARHEQALQESEELKKSLLATRQATDR